MPRSCSRSPPSSAAADVGVRRHPAKAVYLANRHPRLSRPEFEDRWQRHSQIGEIAGDPRSFATISTVRYCLTVDPTGILPMGTDEHDGVGLLALRSMASIPLFHEVVSQTDVPYADELRTFERPVQDVTFYVGSELVVEGAETDVVVLELARRRAGVDPVDHLAQIEEARLDAPGLRRMVRNVLVAPAPRGFSYDVLHELWFDSLDAVAQAAPAIEAFVTGRDRTEPRASTVLVTRVIQKIGRDRP